MTTKADIVLSGRQAARMKVSDDKRSDEVENGVIFIIFIIFMLFSQSRSDDAKTGTIEITTPKRNRAPTQQAKEISMLMENIMSEVAETAAVINSAFMQTIRRPSILGAFCSGRRESCEAKATLIAAIIAMER
jgi:hypothetical protein